MDCAASVRIHYCAASVIAWADLGITLLCWILADMKRDVNAMAQIIIAFFAQKTKIVLHRNADWPAEATLMAALANLAFEIRKVFRDKKLCHIT